MPKFFVPKENIKQEFITLEGEDAKHIATVLRGKKDDIITVCDSSGMDYKCALTDISPKLIAAKILEKKENNTESNVKITLYQALPKGDKMESVIQKCVELGVYEIIPVHTERTVMKLENKEKELKKIARWQKIAQSAAKQSARGYIPKIGSVLSFSEAVLDASKKGSVLMPYELEEKTTIREFIKMFDKNHVCVFIGPEGGFSYDEADFAKQNNGFLVTLGKRILRTETAGMAVLAILYYELG